LIYLYFFLLLPDCCFANYLVEYINHYIGQGHHTAKTMLIKRVVSISKCKKPFRTEG
jgi:hypothetical protein